MNSTSPAAWIRHLATVVGKRRNSFQTGKQLLAGFLAVRLLDLKPAHKCFRAWQPETVNPSKAQEPRKVTCFLKIFGDWRIGLRAHSVNVSTDLQQSLPFSYPTCAYPILNVRVGARIFCCSGVERPATDTVAPEKLCFQQSRH